MKVYLLGILLLLSAAGCTGVLNNPVDDYLGQLKGLVARTETNAAKYDDGAWDAAAASFENLNQTYQRLEPQMTETQKQTADELNGHFLALVAKQRAGLLKSRLKHIYRQGVSLIEHLTQ